MTHVLLLDDSKWVYGCWETTAENAADLNSRNPDLVAVEGDLPMIAATYLGRLYDPATKTFGEPCARPPLPSVKGLP